MDPIRNRVLPIVGGTAIVAIVAAAIADDGDPPVAEPAAADTRHGDLCRRLTCDEQQAEQVAAILRRYDEELRRTEALRREAGLALQPLLAAQAMDTSALETANASARQADAQARQAADAALIALHGVLGPAQRGVLGEVVAEAGVAVLLQPP